MLRYNSAAVITPHASNPNNYDAIMVMVGGTLTVKPPMGPSVSLTLPASGAGTSYPMIIPISTQLVTAAPANSVGLRF